MPIFNSIFELTGKTPLLRAQKFSQSNNLKTIPKAGSISFTQTANDILLCRHTRTYCSLKGSANQLSQTDIDTHSQTVGRAWRHLWQNRRKNCGP